MRLALVIATVSAIAWAECATIAGFAPLPGNTGRCVDTRSAMPAEPAPAAVAIAETIAVVEVPTESEIAASCFAGYSSCLKERGRRESDCAAVRDLCLPSGN